MKTTLLRCELCETAWYHRVVTGRVPLFCKGRCRTRWCRALAAAKAAAELQEGIVSEREGRAVNELRIAELVNAAMAAARVAAIEDRNVAEEKARRASLRRGR